MIGGYLDQDMQYDEVSGQLRAHRYEIPHFIIKDRIIEESQDNEEDSDFEE